MNVTHKYKNECNVVFFLEFHTFLCVYFIVIVVDSLFILNYIKLMCCEHLGSVHISKVFADVLE